MIAPSNGRRTRADSPFVRGYKMAWGFIAALGFAGLLIGGVTYRIWQDRQPEPALDWQAEARSVRLAGDMLTVDLTVNVFDDMGGIVALEGNAFIVVDGVLVTLGVSQNKTEAFSGPTHVDARIPFEAGNPAHNELRVTPPADIAVTFHPLRVQLPDGTWAAVSVSRSK